MPKNHHPPFLPNFKIVSSPKVKTVSRSRGDNPNPVRVRPVDKPRPRPGTPLRGSKDQWDDGSIIYSEGSTAVPSSPSPRATEKVSHDFTMPQKDPRSASRLNGKQRVDPVRDDNYRDNDEDPIFVNRPPEIPYLPVYESCRLLQKRGVSIKLCSTALRETPLRDYLANTLRPATDRIDPVGHCPSQEECAAVNQALTFVLNCGGDVEFHSLLPEQQTPHYRCRTCPATLNSREEDQEHQDAGRRVCEHCGKKNFECHGLYDEHMQEHITRFERMNGTNYAQRAQPDMRPGRDY